MDRIKNLASSFYNGITYALWLLVAVVLRPEYVSAAEWSPPRISQKYDLDEETGFVPSRPLEKLPRTFAMWEDALAGAQGSLRLGIEGREETRDTEDVGGRWREAIRSWPVLSTTVLQDDIRQVQRAHMVLTYLVHFFVHSTPSEECHLSIRIPAALAVPLTEISRVLGMAPILTLADVVLWNWTLVDPSLPISVANIRHENLFSGIEDERSFYATCIAIEFRAAEALKIIDKYIALDGAEDPWTLSKIASDLVQLAEIIDELKGILGMMREVVDPHKYYHIIRHWWKGSGAEGEGSPKWIYEGVAGSEILDLSGPSAGQTPAMHAIDIFLDVDHKLVHNRLPAPSTRDENADRGFMDRMRRYMQGKHRAYLTCLATMPVHMRVRQVAARHPAELQDAYNSAVMALKTFRDFHLQIACLYIITMSKSDCRAMPTEMNESSAGVVRVAVRGTGGTDVATLLKAGRNATARTILPSVQSQATLGNEQQHGEHTS